MFCPPLPGPSSSVVGLSAAQCSKIVSSFPTKHRSQQAQDLTKVRENKSLIRIASSFGHTNPCPRMHVQCHLSPRVTDNAFVLFLVPVFPFRRYREHRRSSPRICVSTIPKISHRVVLLRVCIVRSAPLRALLCVRPAMSISDVRPTPVPSFVPLFIGVPFDGDDFQRFQAEIR